MPVGMLCILMLAFGGALALKAYEERQSADTMLLSQQQREAEALAGHVRAELTTARARMEGLLLSGAGLETIRRNVPFEAVAERDPPAGAWAQLADERAVRVFARDVRGKWISGVYTGAALLPQPLEGRSFSLRPAEGLPASASFETTWPARSALACAPVANAGIGVCVDRPAPLFDLGDLNRLAIYGLLIAAPLLAVYGLVRSNRRLQQDKAEAQARVAASSAREQPVWRTFEVAGTIGLWRWNPKSQLLTVGPEASALIGAGRHGDMTLDELTSMIADDDRRRVQDAFDHARASRHISTAFQGAGPAAGKFFEIIGGYSAGNFTGAIINVSDRISAQHRSRRAEALARTALDAHPGPFAVWDSRKRLTHWNADFVRAFNLDKSIVQPGASYDLVMAELNKFIRVERPLGDDANAREILLLSDIWIRLLDRRTSSDGLITVGLDITNMKRQEAGLQKSERRLRVMVEELQRTKGQAQELAEKYADARTKAERASQAKGSFLSNMSHELRTPLNHINGFGEMMANEIYGPLGNQRYKEYAQDIVEAARHLEEMINDILDMSKVEAGKMRLSPALIDPVDAVDGAVKLARRRAADRDIHLRFDPDDDLPDITGDHRAIKQMTFNLITNAIKFTDPGGEVAVTVTRQDEWIVIRVSDTGIGISEEDLPRLAQPFEQVTSPEAKERNVRGTGLGLALTKSFAEMHGGRLEIESALGVGTTVSIFLPVTKSPLLGPPGNRALAGASA